MPKPLQWLSYANYMRYASEIVAANEFDSLELDCQDNQGKNQSVNILPTKTKNFAWSFEVPIKMASGETLILKLH